MSSLQCPVCRTGTTQPHNVGSVRMLRCDRCSVVLAPPSSSASKQREYYEQQYSLTSTVRISTEMHRYFRYPEFIKLIGAIKKFKDAGRWLDIGCDHGFFIDDVRRFGYEVQGVELSTSARQYATSIGLNVVADINETHGTFDVVSMWHVLEHISEPAEYISHIRQRMSEGGVLTIRVPNAGSFWSRLLRDKWIWFQPHHHCIQFNERSLELLLQENGFTVLNLKSQKPNTHFTRNSYHLSNSVFSSAGLSPLPNLRNRLARMYQDLTGTELFVIAKAVR